MDILLYFASGALCSKSLKMDHVMQVVIRTVNFIRTRGLNLCQFDSLLGDCNITHGVPYHTEVRWFSRCCAEVLL